jgi:hypothetical protein
VHSNLLTALPVVTRLFQAPENFFSEIKFGDCSIRMAVHKVCRLLMIVCLDGFEHSSVEGLQGVCRMRRQA